MKKTCCNKTKNKIKTTYVADYVVVGGGLAGCVMASKLSDDLVHSVICVEAGNNNIYDTPITDSVYVTNENLLINYYPEYFWQQNAVPNGSVANNFCPDCDLQTSNCINGSCINKTQVGTTIGTYSTGKILGGGTSINGQQYVRGTNELFDQWAKIGGSQWSSARVTQVYKQIETYNGKTSDPLIHGYKGPVDIRQAPKIPTAMATKFVTAVSIGIGIAPIPADDYNNPATPFGPFSRWQLTQQPDTLRESSATAYLGPDVMCECGKGINGRKLTILFKSYANMIIWEKNKYENCKSAYKAIGIKIVQNGITKEIFAKKK